MAKRQFFGLSLLLLSLIGLTSQTCFPNIENHLGKCRCKSGTISCLNQEALPNKLGLKGTFTTLAKAIKDNNIAIDAFEELVIVESREDYQDYTMFDQIKFNSIEIHETNLTSIDSLVFGYMADKLKYLYISSDALKSFSDTIGKLNALETLYLVMGLRSIRNLPADSITGLKNLDAILIDGVVATIQKDAINNLPSLERIRITNQLEIVESGAFNLEKTTGPVTVDLSLNRLTNVSFGENFIVQSADHPVTLQLSGNRLTTLPKEVFMTFLNANSGNKLEMTNNPFECGQCESQWVVANFDASRVVGLQCANNKQTSPWKYNWQCKQSNSAFTRSSSVILTILFIASAFLLL